MKRYSSLMVPLLVCAVLLLGAGQSLAGGTTANTPIDNQASVQFTINGSTTTTASNTERFYVDRKIRVVVENKDTGSVSVVAGLNDYALSFSVKNESNTDTLVDTDYFYLTAVADVGNTITMSNVQIYEDKGTIGVYEAGTDTLVTAPVTIGIDATVRYLIVADTPVSNGNGDNTDTAIGGTTITYHLVATAWNGPNVGDNELPDDLDGINNKLASEVVYADPAGSNGDVVENGWHAAAGAYITAATLGVAKLASGSTSGYNIPGDVVTYDITVSNGDPTYVASDVIVSDTIPANTTYSAFTACAGTMAWNYDGSWTNSDPVGLGASYDPAKVSAIRCTIATLDKAGDPNDETTVSFQVTIN